ncbi:MAG: PEGA domain-containing protein, partial [Deltaproteobacteria bacterium]|nr:PEGA domain-containing protein [Deltaproteobacteria bacterium]
LDFGLAKDLRTWAEASVTIKGSIAGSPPYLSPEQIDGTAIDLRTDIYSLGVVLFEMATGSRPYLAQDPVGLFTQHMDAPIPSALERAPDLDLPPALDHLLTRALAKKANDRQDSILDFKREMQECLAFRQSATLPAAPVALLPTESTVTSYHLPEVTEALPVLEEPTRRIAVDQIALEEQSDDRPRPATLFDRPVPGETTIPNLSAADSVEVVETPFSAEITRTDSVTQPRVRLAGFRLGRTQILAGLGVAAAVLVIGSIALFRNDSPATTGHDASVTALTPVASPPAVEPSAPDAAAAAAPPPSVDSGEVRTSHRRDGGRTADTGSRLQRLVRLTVNSQPPGANVNLDGIRICKTPCQTDVVPRGSALLTLQQSGFRDLRRQVSLEADDNDLGTFRLSPIRQRSSAADRRRDKARAVKTGPSDELMPIE